MKITYLDEPTYLPQHAIDKLNTLGEFVVYKDRPSREEAVKRLSETDIAIIEWTDIDLEMLEQVQQLKYIVVALTGYDFVDVKSAKEKGISVSNIPAYSRQSVAEQAFALLLATNRKLLLSDKAAREGKRHYFEPFMGMELYGKTLGILGLGDIGSWMAHIGFGFGMEVIGTSRSPKNIPNVKDVDLDELLKTSDALMISVDRNESTAGMLSKEKLALMKETAFLVSIVSGICDEEALADMLRNGKLAGVGLDMPSENTPLVDLDSAVLSTTTAWYTQDALNRLVSTIIQNVEGFITGKPCNVVNA